MHPAPSPKAATACSRHRRWQGSASSATLNPTVSNDNTIATLAAFTTAGDFTLEDSTGLTITGPLNVGGALDIILNGNGGSASNDLTLSANITTGGDATFMTNAGIIQTGGGVMAGNLSLSAGNGIIQAAGASLIAKANLNFAALGEMATTYGAVTTSGISFAGLLSAKAGTIALTAGNGAIQELTPSATITATALTGSASGSVSLGGATNSITTLQGFTSGLDFTLIDATALTIAGPLTASAGSIDVDFTNAASQGGDLTLAGYHRRRPDHHPHQC